MCTAFVYTDTVNVAQTHYSYIMWIENDVSQIWNKGRSEKMSKRGSVTFQEVSAWHCWIVGKRELFFVLHVEVKKIVKYQSNDIGFQTILTLLTQQGDENLKMCCYILLTNATNTSTITAMQKCVKIIWGGDIFASDLLLCTPKYSCLKFIWKLILSKLNLSENISTAKRRWNFRALSPFLQPTWTNCNVKKFSKMFALDTCLFEPPDICSK